MLLDEMFFTGICTCILLNMRSTCTYFSRILIRLYILTYATTVIVAYDSLFLFSNFISTFSYLIFIFTIFLHAPFLIFSLNLFSNLFSSLKCII